MEGGGGKGGGWNVPRPRLRFRILLPVWNSHENWEQSPFLRLRFHFPLPTANNLAVKEH